MGTYSTRITVSKGPPPDMKHLRRVRKRTRLRRRTIDESQVVDVDRWPLPGRHTQYGVLDHHVSSCNNLASLPDPDCWLSETQAAVAKRLRGADGLLKGRVLYIVGEDWLRSVSALAVMTFHIPRAGTLKILHLETARAAWPDRRTVLLAALLACGQAVARESGDGRTARLEWTVMNRAAALDVRRRFTFVEASRDRQGYHLLRTAVYG